MAYHTDYAADYTTCLYKLFTKSQVALVICLSALTKPVYFVIIYQQYKGAPTSMVETKAITYLNLDIIYCIGNFLHMSPLHNDLISKLLVECCLCHLSVH